MASTDPQTADKIEVNAAASPGGSADTYAEDPYPERKRRADRYFEVHLGNQRNWYSKNAGKSKRWTNFLAFVVLACGAATTVIQLFEGQPWLPLTTAILGAVVVLTKGLESIGRYQENWGGFRKASEGMKREYRLFINNAGDYGDAEGEDEAYRWFVEAVEKVIAEEQNQFWEGRGRRHEAEGGEGQDSGGG